MEPTIDSTINDPSQALEAQKPSKKPSKKHIRISIRCPYGCNVPPFSDHNLAQHEKYCPVYSDHVAETLSSDEKARRREEALMKVREEKAKIRGAEKLKKIEEKAKEKEEERLRKKQQREEVKKQQSKLVQLAREEVKEKQEEQKKRKQDMKDEMKAKKKEARRRRKTLMCPCGVSYTQGREHRERHEASQTHQQFIRNNPMPRRRKASTILFYGFSRTQCHECGVWYTDVAGSQERHNLSKYHQTMIGRFDPAIWKKYRESMEARDPSLRPLCECSQCGGLYRKNRYKLHCQQVRHERSAAERNDLCRRLSNYVKEYTKTAKEVSVPDPKDQMEDKAEESGWSFTAKGFKKFLDWRKNCFSDPALTDVSDVLKTSKSGPLRVDFAKPSPPKKKAFEGWASSVEPPKRIIKPLLPKRRMRVKPYRYIMDALSNL